MISIQDEIAHHLRGDGFRSGVVVGRIVKRHAAAGRGRLVEHDGAIGSMSVPGAIVRMDHLQGIINLSVTLHLDKKIIFVLRGALRIPLRVPILVHIQCRQLQIRKRRKGQRTLAFRNDGIESVLVHGIAADIGLAGFAAAEAVDQLFVIAGRGAAGIHQGMGDGIAIDIHGGERIAVAGLAADADAAQVGRVRQGIEGTNLPIRDGTDGIVGGQLLGVVIRAAVGLLQRGQQIPVARIVFVKGDGTGYGILVGFDFRQRVRGFAGCSINRYNVFANHGAIRDDCAATDRSAIFAVLCNLQILHQRSADTHIRCIGDRSGIRGSV